MRAPAAALAFLVACHSSPALSPEDGERRSCRGLTDRDRDDGPLAGGITAVRELRTRDLRKGGSVLEGVALVVAAEPWVGRAWLERVTRCHVARHRTTVLSDRETDPLAVVPVRIEVREEGPSFVIEVRGGSTAANDEVARRARALVRSQ